MGTMWVAGTIVDVGQSREFKVKQSGGKGGPEQYSYEAHQNFSILVCESDELKGSTIQNVLMIEQDGKIVYDVRPGSTMLADSQKYMARNFRLYYGGEDQMPLADYDGEHGVGNEPAYRGVLLAFFTQFNVTAVGGRIPNFRFLVATKTTHAAPVTLATAATQHADNMNLLEPGASGGIFGHSTAFAPSALPDQVRLDNITISFLCRIIIVPLYDDDPDLGSYTYGINSPEAFSALKEQGIYDSGWVSSAPNWKTSSWTPFWASRGITEPDVTVIGSSLAPNVVLNALPGKKFTGFRKYLIAYGDTGSTYLTNFSMQLTDASAPAGVALTYIEKGIYLGGDGNYYKTPWSTSGIDGVYDPNDLSLSVVVAGICKRGGISSVQIDVSALADTSVAGYAIAKQMNAVNALGPLLGAYFIYASEYDGQIHFKFHGADAVMTVDEADILEANDANDGNVTANLRNNATEFPKRITGQYYDPAQNYMPVTVM
jgi:hypothetical protein